MTLEGGRRVIAAGEKKSKEIGQPMNIVVADGGGNWCRMSACARSTGTERRVPFRERRVSCCKGKDRGSNLTFLVPPMWRTERRRWFVWTEFLVAGRDRLFVKRSCGPLGSTGR